ncbi:MAG: hypothetical protein Rubg2KO_09990 [Rubricoccaceae bacterium]
MGGFGTLTSIDLTRPGTILLDAPRPDADTGQQGTWMFSDPATVIRADRYDEVESALRQLDAALDDGAYVAGMLAYEAGYALEPGQVVDPPVPSTPLVWFGVYEAPTPLRRDRFSVRQPVRVEDLSFGLDREDYRERIGRIKAHIREGDVYQINLTAPFSFRTDADALDLFLALRARQHVAYGAFMRLPDLDVLSVSPELFFRVDGGMDGRTITARPMKGTAPRGLTPEADAALVDALVSREKDRAENLMIVDLLRNDLSRVSHPGSVRVPALFEPERYETLTQMTSTVRADLRPEVGLADTVRALFPCGSVVGAPKLRAMQIIRQLETGPRGAYCGAIGYAAPGEGGLETAVFNVAIRTAVLHEGRGRYDVGSGVVWDSEADAEYDECLLKARVLTDLAQ